MRLPAASALLLIGRESSRLRHLFQLEVEESFHPQAVTVCDECLFVTCPLTTPLPCITSLRATTELLFPSVSSHPEQLLDRLGEISLRLDSWDIEVDCVQPRAPLPQESGRTSTKMLLCSIAQRIEGTPSLYPSRSEVRLRLVETWSGYFIGTNFDSSFQDQFKRILLQWKRRPFSFSAALSLELADAVVNILVHRFTRLTNASSVTELTFLDPCCGSGTTMFCAFRRGLRSLYGCDISPIAVEGAAKNLKSVDITDPGVVLERRDSTLPWSPSNRVDIVIANLPWGENKFEYFGENAKIIHTIGNVTHCYSQVALITQSELEVDVLNKAGLHAHRTVPIDQDSNSNNKRSGKCFVTFCQRLKTA